VLLQLAFVTVMFVEQVNIMGGHWIGFTVTVKLQLVLLLHASVAVQKTDDIPGGKVLPLGGLHTTFTGEQPPVAELV
jgi:hypothetical protein